MSRVIDSLADRHLIERVPDPARRPGQPGPAEPARAGRSSTSSGPGTPRSLRSALAELTEDEQRLVRRAIPVLQRLSDLLQSSERPTAP